ncbi:MAG: nuclear transport factor 2 family protein [Deltaproteobacteria bacterium]|nr:nuclear transport factor 2 family protein [Deltaproteobacteria bacterium]
MPHYTPEERRNIKVTEALFDVEDPRDKALLFADDAVWWNGLPFVGGEPGQTEHKGIDAIRGILTGAGSEKAAHSGVDAYDLSTCRNEDVVVLADGDYVVRQHTMYAKTRRGQDYTNVYCFVFRFNDAGKIQYLTEHWNTWHAYNVLFNNFEMEPAHPLR